MKPAPFPLALSLLLLLVLPAVSVRALDPTIFDDDAPLTPALTQLFTDLEAIAAGSAVSDDQHAALVADLLALPPGPSTPQPADVDQLATDLGTAALGGLITDDEEYTIASDVLVDPTDPDSWFVYLRDEVTYLLTPPDTTDTVDGTLPGDGDPGSGDPSDGDPWISFPWVGVVFYPGATLFTSAQSVSHPSVVYTSLSIPFTAQYYKVAGEAAAAYSGEVRLSNVRSSGSASATAIRVSTRGLPPAQRYQVIVTRSTDAAKVSVGRFRVHGTGRIIDRADEQDPQPAVRKTSSRVVFGQGLRPLSAHFKVNKVSNVTVLDAAGRVRLSRDFDAAAPSGDYVRRAHLMLHAGASGAAGAAVAVFESRDGSPVRNHLRFAARNLPADAALTLLADGVAVGRYTTNAAGHLRVSADFTDAGASTPDFSHTRTVSLTDAQGTVLLTGGL